MSERTWAWRSEYLHAVADLVDGLSEVEETSGGELRISSIEVGLGVELATDAGEDRSLRLAIAPPEQLETGVQPVLHGLRMRLEVERGS